MAVSRRLRFEILRRDNHQCRYCGAAAPDAKLTVDHVLPVALGGSDEASNLVAACANCNGGKSASSPDAAIVQDVQQGALRWAAALQRAAAERDHATEANVAILNWFRSKWTCWFSFPGCYASGDECPQDQRTPMILDDSWGWKRTLARWKASDAVDPKFIEEAIGIAMKKPGLTAEATWRYFCGVVWNEIKERQKLAAKYMVEDDPAPAEPTIDHGQFDYMVMVDAFLDQLVPALGGNDDVRKRVDQCFWGAMPEAHRAWLDRLRDPGELAEHETAQDVATEAGVEHMSSWIAYDMYEIGQWRKSYDRALVKGTVEHLGQGVNDGS